MDFKEYMATYIPKSSHDPNFNAVGMTLTEYFACQMVFIANFSLMSDNNDDKIVHTDQHRRIFWTLIPSVQLINELVTGPCQENINIVKNIRDLGLGSIFMRIVENLRSDFY